MYWLHLIDWARPSGPGSIRYAHRAAAEIPTAGLASRPFGADPVAPGTTVPTAFFVLIQYIAMSFSEGFDKKSHEQEKLQQQCGRFASTCSSIHEAEEEKRLKENPDTEQKKNSTCGAFEEWLEPQVRAAISEMYRKGYATQSSGFHGEEPETCR